MEIKEFCKKIGAVPLSVIEDIKAEIGEPLRINKGLNTESAKAQAIALSWCLEIIDRHISGEEQERSE